MNEACACGHERSEHDPDCSAVITVGFNKVMDFCSCSSFRSPGSPTSPMLFRDALRASLTRERMPDWTALARCREFTTRGRAVWTQAFRDEVAARPEPDDYEWPQGVTTWGMKECAQCPVRRRCLEYAFDRERMMPSDKNPWFWVPSEGQQMRRFGIFGGVPGRIREHFAEASDPVEASDAWFKSFAAKRGWTVTQAKEDVA